MHGTVHKVTFQRKHTLAAGCILPFGRLQTKEDIVRQVLGQPLWGCIALSAVKASGVLPFYGFVANDDNYKEEH